MSDMTFPDYASLLAEVRRIEANPPLGPEAIVDIHRTCTVDHFMPYLKYFLSIWGVRTTVRLGDFDSVAPELISGGLGDRDATVAIVFLYAEMLLVLKAGRADAEATLDRLEGLLSAVASLRRMVIISNFVCPPDARTPTGLGGIPELIRRMNDRVSQFVTEQKHCRLLDLAGIAENVGANQALDRRNWFRFKAPFRPALLGRAARQAATAIAEAVGKSKKCLVLDCDDTLWGGIVGEMGAAGVALDPHGHPGNIYYAFQRGILELQANGVMVALVSKNNEADVFDVIDGHDHCLLRRDKLVGWRINWKLKVDNIQDLAADLNIGLDSIVFVDDSDLECGLIRTLLPDVLTLQVPADLSLLPELLTTLELFPRRSATGEDRQRAKLYGEERERKSAQQEYQDVSSFLASLEMVAAIGRPRPEQISRTAQLMARTNQFMLTGYRATEGALTEILADQDRGCYVLSVSDRFGDLGLVGAMVLHRDNETVVVDGMAVSCRALGREVEMAFFDRAVRTAAEVWGATRVVGRYEPSPKNQQVADFYLRQGLEDEGGGVFGAALVNLNSRTPEYIDVRENG